MQAQLLHSFMYAAGSASMDTLSGWDNETHTMLGQEQNTSRNEDKLISTKSAGKKNM